MRQHLDPLPIVPLGTLDGFVFLVDGRHRFRALLPGDLTPQQMSQLVEPHETWLIDRFPPRLRDRCGYSCNEFRAWIFTLCARRGVVDPQLLGFDLVKVGRAWRWVWQHEQR